MNDIERARSKRDKRAQVAIDVGIDGGTVVTITGIDGKLWQGNRRDYFELLFHWWDVGQISGPEMAHMMDACP